LWYWVLQPIGAAQVKNKGARNVRALGVAQRENPSISSVSVLFPPLKQGVEVGKRRKRESREKKKRSKEVNWTI